MNRIVISLGKQERTALLRLAQNELRSPRDQARYVLRKEMERLGLLETDALEGGISNEENKDAD